MIPTIWLDDCFAISSLESLSKPSSTALARATTLKESLRLLLICWSISYIATVNLIFAAFPGTTGSSFVDEWDEYLI